MQFPELEFKALECLDVHLLIVSIGTVEDFAYKIDRQRLVRSCQLLIYRLGFEVFAFFEV